MITMSSFTGVLGKEEMLERRQKEENIDVFLLDINYSVKNMFF